MKAPFVLLALALAAFVVARSQAPSPVSVALEFPAPGAVVSNRVELSAVASSLAGPIVRVEFYDTYAQTNNGVVTWVTNLIGIATNRNPAPRNLFVY